MMKDLQFKEYEKKEKNKNYFLLKHDLSSIVNPMSVLLQLAKTQDDAVFFSVPLDQGQRHQVVLLNPIDQLQRRGDGLYRGLKHEHKLPTDCLSTALAELSDAYLAVANQATMIDAYRLFGYLPFSEADGCVQSSSIATCCRVYEYCVVYSVADQGFCLYQAVPIGSGLSRSDLARLAADCLAFDVPMPELPAVTGSALQVDRRDDEFASLVEQALSQIERGELFQVVLSQVFSLSTSLDGLSVLRLLLLHAPTAMHFYFQVGDQVVVGASPERLLQAKHGRLCTHPLAGTRPRGPGYDDKHQSESLLTDVKESREHVMLVDLARNDLGRVAKVGSVQVERYKEVLLLPNVMHLASTVVAELCSDFTAFDALLAVFPAGTLSGAPKYRACQMIEAYEGDDRGLYGGCVFFINNNGDLDSLILIRFATLLHGLLQVRAGAGVVLGSDPLSESRETRHKANVILSLLLGDRA